MSARSTGGARHLPTVARVTSSRLETPTNTPGAPRDPQRAPRSSPRQPPARYEPHLDGLFTYCLSVLCDHDAATEALGHVLALAERQTGRCPEDEEERKTWLYALARWMCLRRLAERKQGRRAHRRTDPRLRPDTAHRPDAHPRPDASRPDASRPHRTPAAEAHARELARLAWPEAAGTTPEQREALELAVRHGLPPRAVAAVLGLDAATTRELLAGAACEVERTRAALAVVETGNCPAAGRLTGDRRALLSATLRRELVRHVDDCPRCRRAAERAGAASPWPGKAVTPTAAALPVVEAPRPSAYVAMLHAQKRQKNRSATPRFDRSGFPMDPKDHAARRDRLRSRVMTTTVVATVVAAPVIALWSAYRGAPLTGEGRDGTPVSAADDDNGAETTPAPYENTGNARPGSRSTGRDPLPEVSAEVVSAGAAASRDPAGRGADRLTVETRTSGSTTLITLTASEAGPVSWSAATDRSWVRLSRTSGRLPAGASTTLRAVVDHAREPGGPWTAHLTLAPTGAVVALHGYGAKAHLPGVTPRPARPHGNPHPPVPADPTTPTPRPTEPTPEPTDPTPTPSDPGPSPTPDPAGSSEPPAPPKGPSTPPRAD